MKTSERRRVVRARLAALAPADRLRLYTWLAVTLVLAGFGIGVQTRLHSTNVAVPGTEAARATATANQAFGSAQQLMILVTGPPAQLKREALSVSQRISANPQFSVFDPWSAGSRALLPKPGRAVLLVSLRQPFDQVADHTAPELRSMLRRTVRPPFAAYLTGYADIAGDDHAETVSAVEIGELIAAIPLLVVVLLVLGTPFGAAVPLFLGGTVALAGWGLLDLVNRITPLDAISLNLTTAMALALGIDYSLLMVTRFRSELRSGTPVQLASERAASGAGRTIRFAATVLAVTMFCLLLLIPAAMLKSAVVGVLIAVFTGLIGATLVLPPMLRLIGADINRYQLVPPATDSERWRALGTRVLRRPLLSLLAVLVPLLLLCIPALHLPTGPPDPHELPSSSPARQDFEAIQRSISGGYALPFVLTVVAHKGTLADRRLLTLAAFERQLARDPQTLAVLGPATVAARTAQLASVPGRIRRVTGSARGLLRRGRDRVSQLARGLGEASSGVDQLVGGLAQAASGSERLHSGAARAQGGAAEIDAGVAAARDGAARLQNGLSTAESGARALDAGTVAARNGADALSGGLAAAASKTRAAIPGTAALAQGLSQGAGQLRQLEVPAGVATDQARAALTALDQMLVTSKLDPAYARAYRAVATALGALSGRNPTTGDSFASGYSGLPSSLQQAADEATSAAAAARRLQGGVSGLEQGLGALGSGASRLAAGVARLHRGTDRLAGGEGQLLDGATRLRAGLVRLSAGTGTLVSGLAAGSAGTAQLSSALDQASVKARPLTSGLGQLEQGTRAFQASLRNQAAELARGLPGGSTARLKSLFTSGYTALAALNTAPASQRRAASWAINLQRGGNAVQFLVVQRDPPGETHLQTRAHNPYLAHLETLTHQLGRTLGATALVGGPSAILSELDNAVASKLPLLIVTLVLVSYVVFAFLLRNALLPAIAVSLNAITVAVAFGVLSLGFGTSHPLGGPGYIDDAVVAIVFAAAFALSIDYEIFLLDRMREGYAQTGNAHQAIVYGLENTAGVITGAGAIMVAVFLSFSVSPISTLRSLGLGLVIAIALDATLIRLVLLPAALKLAGDRAWRPPRWAASLLPRLDVERVGSAAMPRPAPTPAPAQSAGGSNGLGGTH